METSDEAKLQKSRQITLHSNKDDFSIDIAMLKEYSNKIKQLDQNGKVPKMLDLSDYDVAAVATLVDYMITNGRTKARITNSILGDMAEIARTLEMDFLSKKIDEFILASVAQSEQFLVHALTMISMQMLLDTPLGRKIIDKAVFKFPIIVKLAIFTEIPLDAILRILDRCDLSVSSEYDVVEAAIRWLAAKPERVHFSYLVLRCIRIINLTPAQRLELFALIETTANYTRIMSAFAHYTFNNTNAHRACLLAEHNSYKRCGNRSGQIEYVINVPNRRITYRKKLPIKASYVTAKPKVSPVQGAGEGHSDGEEMKRIVFAVSQERRTTRAERMARYKEEYKRIQGRHRYSSAMPISTESSKAKSTKSSKSKQSRKQRKTAGSSPDSEGSSTYFNSTDNGETGSVREMDSAESENSSGTDQSSPPTPLSTDKFRGMRND
uniref:BACK domain-containing protein n=1 Tax=Setaria digitata TaxID=48799 RepID=A0A915PWH3_9BILA